jgi:predicted AAA+ superfamily ATPase
MIHREIENKIIKSTFLSPVICITGPRQSGKTTLVKKLFPYYQYYNLEFPEHREYARNDPKSFLAEFEKGLIIDEVQRVPEILSSIQFFVDEKKINGKIVVTGSQNLLLMQSVSQSLAGRVALFTLLPFSLSELENSDHDNPNYEKHIVKGLYPRIYDQDLDYSSWIRDYITTYIERDVRQIIAIKDLALFQNFLQLCAGHIGQIVNFSTFSNNLGVDIKTIKSWLSILETSYIVFLQQPYSKNVNKRLIKSPRLFFYDTGIACKLLGINDVNNFKSHYLKGALFESFIISEIHKYLFNQKIDGQVYFFRDSNGNELDAVIEIFGKNIIIEIKSGKTINHDFFKGFKYWDSLQIDIPTEKYLVYGGDQNQTRQLATVLSWKQVLRMFDKLMTHD